MPSEISFKRSSTTVTEGAGNISVTVERTGDLSGYSNAIVQELWNDSNTTISQNEISYNNAFSGSDILGHNHDQKSTIISFAPGVDEIDLVFNVSDDALHEDSERLYLEITNTGGETVGRSKTYIKVIDNDEPVPTITIHGGGSTIEGDKTTSYAKLSEKTDQDVTFQVSTYFGTYREANSRGEGGDYEGFVDKTFTIKAGKTTAPIPVQTIQNADPNDWAEERFELIIESGSVQGAVVNVDRDTVMILDKAITEPIPTPPPPTSTLPTLTLYPGNDTKEGDFSTSYAELSQITDNDVTFQATTYKGTYNQANVRGTGGDYEGFVDKTFTIKAGQTRVDIPVKTFQNLDENDWAEEVFELGISNVQGATPANSTSMLKIIDVPTWDITPITITEAELREFANTFASFETKVGTSQAAEVIGSDIVLSSLGKTLEALNMLTDGIKNAVKWFAGSTAYASVGDLLNADIPNLTANNYISPFLDYVNNQFDSGTSKSGANTGNWTSAELKANGWTGIKPGDTIDGRVAVTQPIAKLSHDDHDWQVTQGMSDNSNATSATTGMYSHATAGKATGYGYANFGEARKSPGIHEVAIDYALTDRHLHHTDIDAYFYAQAPGTIVSYVDNTTGNGPGDLGNSITIKLDQKAILKGETHDVYVTYAHAKAGSIDSAVGVNWQGKHVEAGTPLGIVSNSGLGNGGKHIHTMFAVDTYVSDDHEIADGRKNPDDDNGVGLPPVYIMGFESSQNGIPRGPSEGVKPEWVGISPTDDGFDRPNFEVVSTVESVDPAGEGFHIGTDAINDNFTGTPGDDHYDGKGGYNQVNYLGEGSSRENFTITTNPDGTHKVVSMEYGTDTLKNIQGLWFQDEFKWYTIEDLLKPINIVSGTEGSDTLPGTDNIDSFIGKGGDDFFVASKGADIYNGGAGTDQVDYQNGLFSQFTFVKNPDQSVTAISTEYGTETYHSIESIWLGGEPAGQDWYPIEFLTVL